MNTILIGIQAFVISLFSTGLRGFQHKNVIKNKMPSIIVTGFLISASDILTIYIVATNGLYTLIWNASGASLGMYLSITLHDKLFK